MDNCLNIDPARVRAARSPECGTVSLRRGSSGQGRRNALAARHADSVLRSDGGPERSGPCRRWILMQQITHSNRTESRAIGRHKIQRERLYRHVGFPYPSPRLTCQGLLPDCVKSGWPTAPDRPDGPPSPRCGIGRLGATRTISLQPKSRSHPIATIHHQIETFQLRSAYKYLRLQQNTRTICDFRSRYSSDEFTGSQQYPSLMSRQGRPNDSQTRPSTSRSSEGCSPGPTAPPVSLATSSTNRDTAGLAREGRGK